MVSAYKWHVCQHMEIPDARISRYGLVRGNELVISTYEMPVCSQHVTNHCMEIHCYQYIRTIRFMFACYSCCLKMTLIVSVWISFRLISAEFFAIWVSIHVHISLDFVVLTICRPLQIVAVSSSWTLTHMPVDMVKTCSFTTARLVSKY